MSRRSVSVGALLSTAVVAAAVTIGGPAAAAPASVDVRDNQFVPSTVQVEAGDAVTWNFVGANPHSVTLDSGQPKAFDSHPSCGQAGGACSSAGQTTSTTFPTAGTYRYFCKIHGGPGGVGMSGTVEVTAAASPSPTAASASPSPTGASPSPSAPAPTPTTSPTASQSSAPPATVTLVAPTVATAGVVVAVSGTAQPGALVELFGVTAPNATLLKVNDTVADESGRWVRTIRPLRNVNLQARVGAASSPTRFIAVSTAVRQAVDPLAGCTVQVSGAVFEPKPGATVFIRAVTSAGRTVELGRGRVERDGRFLLRTPYACGQRLDVYTVISGDNVNRPGATGTQPVTTRR